MSSNIVKNLEKKVNILSSILGKSSNDFIEKNMKNIFIFEFKISDNDTNVSRYIFHEDDIPKLLTLEMNSEMILEIGKKLISKKYKIENLDFLEKYIDCIFRRNDDNIIKDIVLTIPLFPNESAKKKKLNERTMKIIDFVMETFSIFHILSSKKNNKYSFPLMSEEDEDSILFEIYLFHDCFSSFYPSLNQDDILFEFVEMIVCKKNVNSQIFGRKSFVVLERLLSVRNDNYINKFKKLFESSEKIDDTLAEMFYLCIEYMPHDFTTDEIKKFIFCKNVDIDISAKYLHLIRDLSYYEFLDMFVRFSKKSKNTRVLVKYFRINFFNFCMSSLLLLLDDKYILEFILSSVIYEKNNKTIVDQFLRMYPMIIDEKKYFSDYSTYKNILSDKTKYFDNTDVECFAKITDEKMKGNIFSNKKKRKYLYLDSLVNSFCNKREEEEDYFNNSEETIRKVISSHYVFLIEEVKSFVKNTKINKEYIMTNESYDELKSISIILDNFISEENESENKCNQSHTEKKKNMWERPIKKKNVSEKLMRKMEKKKPVYIVDDDEKKKNVKEKLMKKIEKKKVIEDIVDDDEEDITDDDIITDEDSDEEI